jgi:hypothetical protein
MKRIYSCMNGHRPRIEMVPHTQKVLLTCPAPGCGESTHQHNRTEDAIIEWNNAGSRMWTNYEIKWWHWFLRWWHGCFYE